MFCQSFHLPEIVGHPITRNAAICRSLQRLFERSPAAGWSEAVGSSISSTSGSHKARAPGRRAALRLRRGRHRSGRGIRLRARHSQRVEHLPVIGPRLSNQKVVAHGSPEQHGALENHAHLAAERRGSRDIRSCPLNSMLPAVGTSSRLHSLSRLVLPDPETPATTVRAASGMVACHPVQTGVVHGDVRLR